MRELGDAMDNELNSVKPVVEEGGMDGARKFIKVELSEVFYRTYVDFAR